MIAGQLCDPSHAREDEKCFAPVFGLLDTLIQLYTLVLLARIILSWFPKVDRSNPIIQFIYNVTEPVLEPVRRALPPMGGLDLSPIVVFFGIHLLRRILLSLV